MTAISKKSFLVDTNIIVYYLDEKSPFNLHARAFFKWSFDNEVAVVVAQQNFFEVVNTLVKDYRINLSTAISKSQLFIKEGKFIVILPQTTTVDTYCKLIEKGAKGIFDLYLAATAIDNGVNCIMTNDPKGFKGIKGLEVLSLRDIDKLIGGKIRSEHE